MSDTGELDAEIAGQKFILKNVSLATMATIATLILTSLIAYVLYTHQVDAKEAGQAFVSAIKEQTAAVKDQTVAAREQNCLMRFSQNERQQQAEFCKTISR